MDFDYVWGQVQGLPDTAIKQVPEVLSERTKRRLSKLKPEEVSIIVRDSIDEVNGGSIAPLDVLIQRRL